MPKRQRHNSHPRGVLIRTKKTLEGFRPTRKQFFIGLFCVAGLSLLLFVRAASPAFQLEAENSVKTGTVQMNDSTASAGSYLQFGSGTTTPPPTSGMPTKQSIIDGAGPSNPGALKPSGSIVVTTAGAVIQDVNVSGSILVKANDVTIRNCKVTGSSSAVLVKLEQGFRNMTVENCRIEVNTGGANGAVGSNGGTTGIKIRRTEILGYADGIKADNEALYEYNYIHMYKPAGSIKHLDGIQGSGRRDWTARYNAIDMRAENGGNFSIFAQSYTGAVCVAMGTITASHNYIYGGNYGINISGLGKPDKCATQVYLTKGYVTNNVFQRDADQLIGKDANGNPSNIGFRWGYYQTSGPVTLSENKLEDGRPLTGPQTPL